MSEPPAPPVPTPDAFAELPGAVLGDDGATVQHYGEPVAEQRRLQRGSAVVDLPARGVVTLTGGDRLALLDSITSQALGRLHPGESSETLQLDPAGRVEFVARVLDDGDTAWLLVDDAPRVAAWLTRMRFRMAVEVADVSADHAVLGSFGDALELPAAAPHGVPVVWVDPWASPTGHTYATADEHPGTAWTYRETVVERAELAPLAARAASGGLGVAGALALEALRIAAWRPGTAELDERSIPHELDWLRTAVHLAKGCYRGQETVAKVHNLGHPPRRLVQLDLDGSDAALPRAGAEVLEGDEVVGRVTASALHHEAGPIALAVVRRRTDPDAVLRVRDTDADGGVVEIAAAQQIVVPVDAGAVIEVPRMPRLGAAGR